MEEVFRRLSRDPRVIFMAVVVLLSVYFLFSKGLSFGLDLVGGSRVVAKLEKRVNPVTFDTVISVLQERLNRYGLRDIVVKPMVDSAGNQYVLVELAGVPEEEARTLITSQGKFEQFLDHQLVLTGADIVTVEPYRIEPTAEGWRWHVPFKISPSAARRFAEIARGKAGRPVYIFLDRPEKTVIIAPPDLYMDRDARAIANISGVPVLPANYTGLPEDAKRRLRENYSGWAIIVAGDQSQIPDSVIDELRKMGFEKIERKPRLPYEDYAAWMSRLVGLVSAPRLGEGLAQGVPVTDVEITGVSPSKEAAIAEAKRIKAIIEAGALPVNLEIVSIDSISPSLGRDFKESALLAGIVAAIAVAVIVSLRYRDPLITLFILVTSFSEVLIILGVASAIRWSIDMAAIAGIILAVGTGVDHQIIITDETFMELGKQAKREKVRFSLRMGVRKAFDIILGAAATTIAAMLILATMGMGVMKGFAVTTIIGVIAGVGVTRPAYGKIIQEIETYRRLRGGGS